jgi:hypothetical protein
MMRSSINGRLNARSLLTAEQRTKLAQLRQSRSQRGRMSGAEGRAPGRPDPRAGQGKDRIASPPAARDPQPE